MDDLHLVDGTDLSAPNDERAEAYKHPQPQLGEWRMIKAKAFRDTIFRGHSRTQKRWVRQPLKEPIKAMFIGSRTGNNGEREWGDEVGYIFYPDQPVELWLFVDNARRKPFHVFPDDVRNYSE